MEKPISSNVQVNPFRFFRNTCTLASKPGAALEWKCLTDIPSSSRGFNNVKLKSFDIDLKFMPVTGANQPTWLCFAIVVQTGVYADPIATNLIGGLSHSDNYINMSTDREGWMNRTFPLNSLYKVIYAKTLMMAPLLEAGATSVQSNLSAQIAIRQCVKYPKFIQYDSGTDNVPLTNNVFMMYWFDDDFRLATAASTTTHRCIGDIKTNYRNTEF